MLIAETDAERRILQDSYFQDAILIGKMRCGHPEGCLGTHIEHMLSAVELFPQENRSYLRIGAMLHDVGKFAEYGKPHLIPDNMPQNDPARLLASSERFRGLFPRPMRDQDRYTPSHAVHSYQYAKQFTDVPALLELILYHDTAWRIFNKGGSDRLFGRYFSKTPALFVMFAYIDSIDRETDVPQRLESKLVTLGLMHPVLPNRGTQTLSS